MTEKKEQLNNHSAEVAIAEALVDIHEIVSDLQSTNSTTEPHFLSLGSGLQNLFSESNEMTRSAQRTVNTVSQEHNISAIIDEISSQILTRFNDVRTSNMKILDHATRASSLLRNLAKTTPEIRKIDKELWILGSNMAIQAAWSLETEQLFGEYSEELKQFSKSIKSVFLEFQRDLKGMHDSMQELQSSIRTETQRLEELMAQSRQNIQDATNQLEKLLSDSVLKIRFIEETSIKMSKGVSDAVTAIQFNDITRQQLEHVIDALRETNETTGVFELYRCMRVQEAQMDQVSQILAEATNTLEKSFNEIRECGGSIVRQYQSDNNVRLGNSPFAKIKTALRELEDLMALSMTLRERTIQSMQIASIASDRLASHLDKIAEITGELNLQAINALVMSRNIGKGGSSLVALSKEVHSLSKTSTSTVAHVVDILTEVGTQTYELSLLASEDTALENTARLKQGFDEIDEIGVLYASAIDQTTALSQELQAHAHSIGDQSGFIRVLGDNIRQANSRLKDAASRLAAHAIQEGQLASDLEARYTMESERVIHDRVQRELNGSSSTFNETDTLRNSAVESTAGNDAVSDEAFGDFELF
ncbi:MAG: methyl-accepting chemotaxis protein [Deltaproteobacteria bacterium]|nr:methyl-accepting chemotaxis protein [Deltaproteobacteria bacterium]